MKNYKCCECGKTVHSNECLTTGFDDDQGNSEVVCLKCDVPQLVSDGF